MIHFDVYPDQNNQPDYDKKGFEKSIGGGRKRITVEDWSDMKELSEQQRKWWKGILLPKLAEDTGDSLEYWETKLKLSVMPEEFVPVPVPWGKKVFLMIPSVKKLSCKKMTQLIEGSVAKCHEWGLMWVTLPDAELRK